MAAPETRVSFYIRRLKGFWETFKRNKRGLLGLMIILFFVIVAVAAPLLTPYDPLDPKISGYPAGRALLAERLAKPVWYKYLPGAQNLSENMEIVSDYRFDSSQALGEWDISTEGDVSVTYDPNFGLMDEKQSGGVKISYERNADDPVSQEVAATLTRQFEYPYNTHPVSFWIHMSYLIDGTVSTGSPVSIETFFHRGNESYTLLNLATPSSSFQSLTGLSHKWIRSRHEDIIRNVVGYTEVPMSERIGTNPLHPGIYALNWVPVKVGSEQIYIDDVLTTDYVVDYIWGLITFITPPAPEAVVTADYTTLQPLGAPEKVVFRTAGNYKFVIQVRIDDDGHGEEDIDVYLDNLNVILYGNTFGLLGTDGNYAKPRDLFTSLVYGTQLSLVVGLTSAFFAVTIGLVLGLISGYLGGFSDELVMRFADFFLVLPTLPLLIVLIVVTRPSIWNVVLILSLFGWMSFSRTVRSMVLSLRERPFVEAAKAAGAGSFYILFKHILPNVFSFVYITLATFVPGAIITEASLSWLGLFDPMLVSWGRTLYEFSQSGVLIKGLGEYWFWVIPPGVAIALLAMSFILIGFALDEVLNPKLRRRR